jgi:hypothetical protein
MFNKISLGCFCSGEAEEQWKPPLHKAVKRYAQSPPLMNAEEYKSLIKQKNVLDHTTLTSL